MIDLNIFSTLIALALLATSLAPLILLALIIIDWKKGDLW